MVLIHIELSLKIDLAEKSYNLKSQNAGRKKTPITIRKFYMNKNPRL